MKKIIIYTVNLNGYDRLNPSPLQLSPFRRKDPNVRYLYFTDGEAPAGWEKIPVVAGERKDSRYIKINSHKVLPPHDISIYVDASAIYHKKMDSMADWVRGYDLALPKHPKDDCVYKHAGTCLSLNLDEPRVILGQINRYMQEGLPVKNGLTENGLIIRRNTLVTESVNNMWWEEYRSGSQRDQLSLPYVLWKLKPKVRILPFSARENRWFRNDMKHLKPRQYNGNI